MKVFDVLVESLPDGWSLSQEGRRWVARDPSGTVRAVGRVRGNVEADAREYAARRAARTPTADPETRSAADRGDSERGRPERRSSNTRREPRLSRDVVVTRNSPVADPNQRSAADRGSAERPGASDDLRPGVRQGTPTTKSLSAGERRRLARKGEITRRGVTYTRAQITAADAEAARLGRSGAGSDIRPGDDRPRAASDTRNPQTPDTPDDTPDSKTRRAVKAFWNFGPVRFLRRLLGPGAANAINSAINAAAVEDALDAYLRAFIDYANSLPSSERREFLNAVENNNISAVSPELQDAYLECVERISQLIIEAIVGVFAGVGGAALAAVILAKLGLATGGIGIILALIGGGALAIGGTALLYRTLEAAGVNDLVENYLVRKMITFGGLYFFARGVDGLQNTIGAGADLALELPSNIPGIGGLIPDVGDMVRDAENDEDADRQELPQINSDEAVRNLKRLVKSDPELMQAYQAGKEEAKEILRSTSDQR